MEGVQVRWAALLLLVTACQPPDATKAKPPKFQLEGSATQLYDLGYDEARILLAEEDFAVLFVRTRPLVSILSDGGIADNTMVGMTEDYPLKVTYSKWGNDIPVRTRVDLAEVTNDEAKTSRVLASRDVLNDPRKNYPAIRIGSLYLSTLPVPGGTVNGDFNITFTNGSETASGRTVFGTFKAKVAQ